MKYSTINIQGNLLSEEILQKIETAEAQGQKATDFGFEPGTNLRSEIEYAWSRIKLDWKHFSDKAQNLPASDPYGTTLSRRWMEQFFNSLGFNHTRQKSNLIGDNNQGYAISHTADNLDELPIHIVGYTEPDRPDKNTLDIKTSGSTSRMSAHATMQEYLNVTEHLFGIATNGFHLRLIRDSGRLIKLTYIEFDLKRMLDEDKYSEFTVLFRLLHASRFPHSKAESDQCLLEKYYQDSIEAGNRIRDGLSLAVKESLLALGQGFLQHESNHALREKIQNRTLSPKEYYRQLLRIIYRFLFLMVTEERDLVYDPDDKTENTQRLKKIYWQFYSIARLRKLCENRYVFESQYNDLWQGLVQTFLLFEDGGKGKKLGIQPLAGDLFSYTAIKDLQECLISNKLLLECVRNMNEFRDEKKNLVHINYRSLDVEELGSVYEGLLELHPVIENIEAENPAHINFTFHEGTDRKTTGSYYTRPELVNELIKSALIPVIEERLNESQQVASGEWRVVNGEWLKGKFQNLIINLAFEYENISGIRNLATGNGIDGDGLPINKLLSQRSIVWDDFSAPQVSSISTGKYSRGVGKEQQQGIQQLLADSQWKSKRNRNSPDIVSQGETLSGDANKGNTGININSGKTTIGFPTFNLNQKQLGIIWNQLPIASRHSLLANHQLLSLKVCDAAAGSGHMVLAAARTIAWYLARVQSGEENPAPSIYRHCLREVIQHCIYAVDTNPDAVELCKLALWLEGHNSGKPLSFLDHKIRCGNSLVGVTNLSVLQKGIPEEAYNPVTGDDKKAAQWYKKLAKEENKPLLQTRLDFDVSSKPEDEAKFFAHEYKELEELPENNVADVKQKVQKFNKLRNNPKWFKDWNACNIWTSAFFYTYTQAEDPKVPTSAKLKKYLKIPTGIDARIVGKAWDLAIEHKFFHWPLEFPDVFEQGGFDVMLGNPPWERIKLQQQEYFATRDAAIANAPNAAARNKLINVLPQTNPELYKQYEQTVHTSDSTGKFLRESGRCVYTAVGDINTYSIFSELTSSLVNTKGRTGIIVPTGIATDDSNKAFFGAMVEQNRLISLFDFENREKIFRDVDSRYKFCLLTLSASDIGNKKATFGFFLTNTNHLQDKLRIFNLSKDDFLRLNPNTKTCPVFRTSIDAQLTTKIYQRVPVLINEQTDENTWGVRFSTMFHMSNDSHLFRTKQQLEAEGFTLWGNKMKRKEEVWLPLYEAKMIWHYDHRFGSYAGVDNRTSTQTPTPVLEQYQNPNYQILPWYWVEMSKVKDISNDRWFIGFRDITNNTNERTAIISAFPLSGVSNKMPIFQFDNANSSLRLLFLANFSTLVFDFIPRQKIGGTSMNYFYIKQLVILPESLYPKENKLKVIQILFELVYTSWDIKSFADDVWKEADEELKEAIRNQWEENKATTGGHDWNPPEWSEEYGHTQANTEGCPLPPFKWDEERRAVLKAELDAIYAKLYGLTTEELRYILDPQDVYGPDFPGETFRVLKEKEIRLYGEYRTRRLVLEAWERLNKEEKL